MTRKVQLENMTTAETTTARRRLAAPSLRTIGAILVAAGALAAVILVSRSDGYPRQTVRVFAGTRWLVDRPDGRVVLADAVTGRATIVIDAGRAGATLDAVQGPGGAFLVDSTANEVLTIDADAVQLADARRLPVPDGPQEWRLGAGTSGATAITDRVGFTVPEEGSPTELELEPAQGQRLIALDGAVWTITVDGFVVRNDAAGREPYRVQGSLDDVELGALGAEGVLLDRIGRGVHWIADGTFAVTPPTLDVSDAVIQQPGASAPCVWIGAGDQVVCIAPEGVVDTVRLTGFTFDRTDRLLVAAGVIAIVRAGGDVLVVDRVEQVAVQVTGVDWTTPAELVAVTDELTVWVDDPTGSTAVAITAQHGPKVIRKDDARAIAFSPDGEPIVTEADTEESGTSLGTDGSYTDGPAEPHVPDDDGIDDPPVATDDSSSGMQDTSLSIPVTSNDYDPDGGPVAVVAVGKAEHGTARVLSAGAVVYEPRGGYLGTDTFTYDIVDATGNSASADVEVHVFGTGEDNQAPSTSGDRAQTVVGKTVEIDVLANDIDPEQQALVISEVAQPPSDRGVVSVIPAAVTGRPMLRFESDPAAPPGTVTFTYRAADSEGAQSADTTVRVEVNPAGNRPPLTAPDAIQVRRGTSATIPVLANDIDPDNDPLSIVDVRIEPRSGTVQIVGDNLVLQPATNAPDRMTFTYTAGDPDGEVSEATVLVIVLDAETDNRDPIARADTATAGDTTVTIDPLVNDEDPDGDLLVVDRATMVTTDSGRSAGGIVERLGSTQLRFTPAAGFRGVARITYAASDGRGGTATSMVTVTVTGETLSLAPVARDDRFIVEAGATEVLDVLANDVAPGGGTLSISGEPACSPAECKVTADNRIEFRAPVGGSATPLVFTYEVRDANDRKAVAAVVVRVISVEDAAVPQPPIAQADQESVTAGIPELVDVLANDEDLNGSKDQLRVSDWGRVEAASITARPGGLMVSVPADSTVTSFQFSYEITDAEGLTATASVTIIVDPPSVAPDQGPSLEPIEGTITAGESFSWALSSYLRDDRPVDEIVLRKPAITSGAELGTVSATGLTVKVDTNEGQRGTLRIRVEFVDRAGNPGAGTITVTVNLPDNSAPTAENDSYQATAGESKDLAVLTNDEDLDGDAMRIELRGDRPADVRLELIDGATAVRFRAGPDHPGGSIRFSYVAIDGIGATSAPATVTVAVAQCSQIPPSTPDIVTFTPFEQSLTLTLLDGDQANYRLTFANERGGRVRLTGTPGVVSFVPDAGNSGAGSFAYTATNSCGQERTGQVTVDVNRAPTVRAASFSTLAGVDLDLAVGQFASDEEPLVITGATSSSGQVTIIGATTLRFAPGTAAGTATIDVAVQDPGGLQGAGRLSITVTAVDNLAPIASDDRIVMEPGAVVPIDVLGNDTDPDGPQSALTARLTGTSFTIDGQPVALVVSGDGRSVVATVPGDAHGTGSFTYRAADGNGGLSEPATVRVTVNRPPAPVTRTYDVEAGTELRAPIYPGSPADPDGDDIVSLPTFVSHPGVSIDFAPGFIIVLRVAADVPTGVVTARYTITDTLGGVTVANLTINVTNPSSPASVPPPATAAPTVPPVDSVVPPSEPAVVDSAPPS